MYPYHNKIKQRISKDELIGYEFVDNYPRIGECLVLYFITEPCKRPIRPYRYTEYMSILKEWDTKQLDKKENEEKGEDDMNELLKVNLNDKQEPIISGRELHKVLEVKTEYRHWFKRMVDYGFTENADYTPVIFDHPQNKQPTTDHALKLDMAKEIAMLQRNEKGKQVRQYFIEVEKEYNSPEKVMARALILANNQIETLTLVNKQQEQIINELQPKATYYDLILQCKDLLSITQIAKDYGKGGAWLNKTLNQLGIQYKLRDTWLLYSKYADKGYTGSKTQNYVDKEGYTHSKMYTYWTQKGRLFIYEKLKKQGILPLIEIN